MATDSSKARTERAEGQTNGGSPNSPRVAAAGAESSAPTDGVQPSQPALAETNHAPPNDQPASLRPRFWDRSGFLIFAALPSWLTSMVVHIIALLALALVSIPAQPAPRYNELTVGEATEPAKDLAPEEDIQPLDVQALPEDDSQPMPEIDTTVVAQNPTLTLESDLDAAPLKMEFDPLGNEAIPQSDMLSKVGALGGTGLEGRGAAARSSLVRKGGGTKASEAAVAAALKWFAIHQNSDGSWDLDFRFGPCQSRCRNPGTRHNALNGATGLALLPFLGAGQTHLEGKYKETVKAGIQFLLRSMKVIGRRGSLVDEGGNYYSHGIGAIVLCEAYAMTKDKSLAKPAQMAIYETAYAQDPIGGGWRYQVHQRGDTSALGWQLMALKSAHMAYLDVPSQTYIGASKFLDSVQADSGAKYGYLEPGTGKATTAVGLLCRMYLGWKRDSPPIERGVAYLKRLGPSESNMYYDYYATQVMRHYGGAPWKVWNEAMRDYLVRTQSQIGHEKGSWYFRGGGHAGDAGGRLYATSMACMILEVYYRYMPIYKEQASEEDFPL